VKLFTVEQAEALIPELEKIFDAVAELAAQAHAKAQESEKLAARKPDAVAEIAMARGQTQFLAGQIEAKLKAIMDLGAVPKGLDPALVDFPGEVDGEEVFLCWKLGEKRITTYHGIDDGYANRKPLPRRRPS
jgi:hypothetical protein